MQTTALLTLPATWVASHPSETPEWRKRWIDAGVGDIDQWNRVRVVAAREMLWLFAGDPTANTWLTANLDRIASVVTDTVSDIVPIQLRDRPINVRLGSDRLWAYRIPALVVAKSGADWKPHFEPTLPSGLVESMARSIEKSIRKELLTWDRLPPQLADDSPFLIIQQPGRPVVIPAIRPERSGHGRAVSVLVRRQLVALSPVRIEGDVFAGPLNALGYGRLLRTQPPDVIGRDTQRALLSLPVYNETAI